MTKFVLRLSIAATLLVALSVVPAFAYNEALSPDGRVCSDCHGLESITQETSTVAQSSKPSTWSAFDTEAGRFVGSRKGPHGGYTAGTQKCSTCHMIHGAAGNTALLAEATIEATCQTCHDGTGGSGVYGAIQSRTTTPSAGGHRVGAESLNASLTVTVPGGATNGASLDTTFTGAGGALTCTDCHSPHNSDTVMPYIGDRKRSTLDTSTRVATNRLLRRKPTLGTVAVNNYGSNWCESCHKGGHSTASVKTHPVSRDASGTDGTFYNKVVVRSGYNTTTASSVATDLGGSNLGYVVPTSTVRPAPICQQCHEDTRSVGDVQKFAVDSATESFTVNTDGLNGGNPRFQNFPHETQGQNLLIEQDPDLCLNCH